MSKSFNIVKKGRLMANLDLKDRKILYHLDINCRQSNSQIGKKIGLSKQVVDYRIKRMEELRVIKNYYSAINTFKLGYDVFRLYITFQDVTPKVKDEIIKYFTTYKDAWAVLSMQAPIDLDVVLWVKNIYEFYNFWSKTLDRYEDYFSEKTISIYIEGVDYKKSFLLVDDYKNSEREICRQRCGEKPEKIDVIDYQILNELALNARVSLIDLSRKMNCSSQTINYRIKNLMKIDVIQAFHVHIDYEKLGMQNIFVDLYLKDYKHRNQIIEYLKYNPYLSCMNLAIGWSDLQPEFVVQNIEALNQIIEDMNSKLPQIIRKYTYWIMTKVHKERWLPEMDFK
jgi:Lrp/AsnC family leucine-responsive transcriptional regulator